MATGPAKAGDLNAACGGAAPENHKISRSRLHAELDHPHTVCGLKIKKIAPYLTVTAVKDDNVNLLGSKCSFPGLLFPLLSCTEYGPGPRAARG